MPRLTLAEMGILGTNSGIWIHQCPHSEGDLKGRGQARVHGQELRDRGITGIMQFGSTTRIESSIGYREVGISTIFRPWRGHTIGAPASTALMPANEVAQFVAAGTKIIQPFNEQNLPDEWLNGTLPKRADWARIVVDLYETSLDWYESVGAYSALPPLSPGGVYGFQHRECWDMMLAEIVRRNLQSRIKVVCLHPRPHNFPPETPYSDTLTVAFREYERHIATAKSAGIDAWYYAGEHGASIGNRADPARPEVDLPTWTDWNRTFYLWMNPDHASPYKVQPEMFALCYWLSGDGGTWFEDSIDQGRGRMPAPSPLYVWMGEHKDELGWTRGDDPSPPPVPPAMPGATDLRATLPRNGEYPQRTLDQLEQIVIHHSGPPGWLQGVKADEYARRIAVYHIEHNGWPGIGYAFVIGPQGMICQCTNLIDVGNHVGGFNTASIGICLLGDYRADKNVRPPGEQIAAARAVIDWLRSQIGSLPYVGHKDLNPGDACPGDTWDIWKGELESPEPPEERLLILDITGTQRDWAWLVANYGAVEILPSDGYQVTKIIEVEGLLDFTCTLLNEAGAPVAGQQVAYVTPTQEYIEITDSYGVARHTAGSGEGYWLPGPGLVGWYVVGQEGERVTGLGWLRETQYRHLQFTMQLEGEPQPPPPDDWQADTTARLQTLQDSADRIEQLVLHGLNRQAGAGG